MSSACCRNRRRRRRGDGCLRRLDRRGRHPGRGCAAGRARVRRMPPQPRRRRQRSVHRAAATGGPVPVVPRPRQGDQRGQNTVRESEAMDVQPDRAPPRWPVLLAEGVHHLQAAFDALGLRPARRSTAAADAAVKSQRKLERTYRQGRRGSARRHRHQRHPPGASFTDGFRRSPMTSSRSPTGSLVLTGQRVPKGSRSPVNPPRLVLSRTDSQVSVRRRFGAEPVSPPGAAAPRHYDDGTVRRRSCRSDPGDCDFAVAAEKAV